MNLIRFTTKGMKISGVTVFKLRVKNGCFYYYFLGIPVYRTRNKVAQTVELVQNNKDFDTIQLDKSIAALVDVKETAKGDVDNDNIAYLATTLYEMGGHSKCLRDLAHSLKSEYKQCLFLTNYTETMKSAPRLMADLQQYMEVKGSDLGYVHFAEEIRKFAQEIIDYAPKALLVYIHPKDVCGAAVLSVLKAISNIKIIYFNHASHFPNVGMSFANIILEGMPATVKVTHEKRHLYNTEIIGLQSLAKDDTRYLSEAEKSDLKKSIGIAEGTLLTMSGGTSYKFFDKDGSSYFQMIKRLLSAEKNLYHVVMSELKDNQKAIVENIFKDNEDCYNRLVWLSFQTDFDKYFQCADVFIDSFPISSALTQIDLMRNKVASVVKINKEIPEYSFHEYQMPDYPYMFESVSDMENGILELLHDEHKRADIIEKNYNYWLQTYESCIVRDKVLNIINGDING